MKKITSFILGLSAIALVAFAPAKVDTYKVDTQKSNILWVGKKVVGSHNGAIKLSSGTITANGKVLTGGSFVIDMQSMTDADNSARLLGHLKSDDFFGVEKYPTAQFVVTKVTPAGSGQANVAGNLTIKGVTSAIKFPATYSITGNTLTAVAKDVKVDRTIYNIKYGSKTLAETVADKAIDDEFILNITLVATK
jgi:polyisoprenoid-binding protein YceI